MGYRKNPDWSWDSAAAATGMTGLMIFMAILISAVVLTLILILMRELIRIWISRAGQPTRSANILRISLVSLLGCWLVLGALMALSPATLEIALVVASFAFLAFVIVAEICDIVEQKNDQERLLEADSLENYLDPFVPSGNGKKASPVGMR